MRRRHSKPKAPRSPSAVWRDGVVRLVVPPGLEDLMCDEMDSLGIEGHPVVGGFEAAVNESELIATHLYSRLAAKVMFEVGGSSARSLEALAQGVRGIPWALYLRPEDDLKIQIELRGSRLKQKSAIEKKVRWALKDVLSGGKRGGAPRHTVDHRTRRRAQEMLIRVKGQKVWFSLNASGEHLYRRGWRTHVSQAPIRENLAAAMLALSRWSPGEPLVDPMCGAGTIPIEAGCIARGISPGQNRRFAFQDWPCHNASLFESMQKQSRLGEAVSDGLILGGDINARSIEAAVHNVGLAGLTDHVFFQTSPLKGLQVPGQPGLILTNPPYGYRLNDAQNVGDLYGHIGRVLKTRWAGWRVGLLVPDVRLEPRIGLGLEPVASFRNGGISVWLMLGIVKSA
jgi:putative N6-adenine-specific DNA methylase